MKTIIKYIISPFPYLKNYTIIYQQQTTINLYVSTCFYTKIADFFQIIQILIIFSVFMSATGEAIKHTHEILGISERIIKKSCNMFCLDKE